jgi:hypothetical protein
MVGQIYTGGDLAREREQERERCAKIAEAIARDHDLGDGEIYIARKIADAIRQVKVWGIHVGQRTEDGK